MTQKPAIRRRSITHPVVHVGIGVLLSGAVFVGLMAFAEPTDPERAVLPEFENGHRPLRLNPQDDQPPGTVPADTFIGYPGAPDLSVVGRIDELSFYPCSTCHSAMPVNPERRELMAPHQRALDHGDGRIWCLNCHAPESRDQLATLAGDRLSFDQADQVCAQCHATVHQDWTFGVHGKRVGRWEGPREIYSCAHCHDPHDPAVRPRAPEPPPPVRAGLEPMPEGDHHEPLYPRWQHGEETDHEEDAAG
jgi:hypothetical protein